MKILPKCPAFSCPKLPPPSNYPTDFDQTKGTAGGNHIIQTNTRGPDAHSHLPHRPAPQEPFQVENREKVIFRPPRSTGLAPHNHHLNNHAKWSCGHDRRLTCSTQPPLVAFIGVPPGFPHQNKKANPKIPHRVPPGIAPHRHHLNNYAKSSCRDSHRLTFAPRPFLRYSQRPQPSARHQLSHSQNHALRKEGELNYFPPIAEKTMSKVP